MNTERLHQELSPMAYAAFREAAKQGALQDRRDAIDAFWSALGGLWVSAWRAWRPAAHRVACRA